MREIFYEVVKEAYNGRVIIDNDPWSVGWNTIIYDNENIKCNYVNDDNLSVLTIKNEDRFFNLLEEYINLELQKNRKSSIFVTEKEKNHVKILMTYLFVNATTEDFLNPENFLRRNISYLKDDTFSYLNDGITLELGPMLKHKIKIKNTLQSIFMETPNKMEISIVKGEDENCSEYKLPEISYAISDDGNGKECYIYSILNKKEKNGNDEKFVKEVSRKLYKINKDVIDTESEEYLNYKEGKSDYYPENISDVSVSAVLSLIVFLTLLKKEDIKVVKGIPYLPLRYLSRKISADSKEFLEKEKLYERNDLIQQNITEKFIRTFRRAAFHMDGVFINSYPYEVDEFITLKITNENVSTNNEFLNEVTSSVGKQK